MNAEIIAVGDELLIGQVINTNAAFLGEKLSETGISVRRMTCVGDDAKSMRQAFSRAWEEQDVVIVTGGLGPTHDDITRTVVTDFFGTKLLRDDTVLGDIRDFFTTRGREMQAIHEAQALVPATAKPLRNRQGTAPGFLFQRDAKYFCALPGVPHEMRDMVEYSLLPLLHGISGNIIRSLTILTTGIYETTLAAKLGPAREIVGTDTLAFLPSPGGVRLRLTVSAPTPEEAQRKISEARTKIYDKVPEFIFGEGKIELEEVVGNLLRERRETVAVAESCTGGLIGHRLTNVPGSSNYFLRDVVAYSNASKMELLHVPEEVIARHGAVSSETACCMADNIRSLSGATYGIATTGIAGPGGGTAEKPVGLIWIGISTSLKVEAFRFLFGDQRLRNKERSATAALEILRRTLLGLPVNLY